MYTDMNMDVASDMAVSISRGSLKGSGVGVDPHKNHIFGAPSI